MRKFRVWRHVNLRLLQILTEKDQMSDVGSLLLNAGLGSGDTLWLDNNPLSQNTLCYQIPALEARGITVYKTGTCLDNECTYYKALRAISLTINYEFENTGSAAISGGWRGQDRL